MVFSPLLSPDSLLQVTANGTSIRSEQFLKRSLQRSHSDSVNGLPRKGIHLLEADNPRARP
jgi:hypothetical protein